MTSPRVSVVLIFFNDQRFLPEAVESVFAQTFPDWELLLVDDGSTDGSTSIAHDWADRHGDRVRYLDHPGHANLGPPAARNLGWRHARGRLVAILDSDDAWLPTKLADQVAILDDHPEVGMVVGASLYWHSWAGTSDGGTDRVRPVGAPLDRVHHPPDLAHLLHPLGPGIPPCPSSWLVRRDTIERLGGWVEHLPPTHEDQGFLAKAYQHVPIWVSSQCWDRYRRHAGAMTVAASRHDAAVAEQAFLEWYAQYLHDLEVDDPETWRRLRRAQWPHQHPHLAHARHVLGTLRERVRRRLSRA